MTDFRTSIFGSSGAVTLSREVVCDGFLDGPPLRVQTHVHEDHMDGFDTSKGVQDIVALPGTRELLIASRDADLPYRANFQAVSEGESVQLEHCKLALADSGHMLGAAQVLVEHDDGYRTGYSSDFAWPLTDVIEVDELVLDSTYGSPNSIRRYSQDDADNAFRELLLQQAARGPVYVKAFSGTVGRALSVLHDSCEFPVITSAAQLGEAGVYARNGYPVGALISNSSEDAREAMAEGRFVVLQRMGERPPAGLPCSVIVLRAFLPGPDDPVFQVSDAVWHIGMSGHADFAGTLEYVAATGATRVLTDNVRGPHGAELAIQIRNQLGIRTLAAMSARAFMWGR